MFEQLVAFKKKYGHCNVPQSCKDNKQLGLWVAVQRRTKELSLEKRDKLDSIRFDWDPLETYWNQKFEQLKAFKENHGHCNVPIAWKENRPLGVWVATRRSNKDHLSPEKRARLDSIGFDWDPLESSWNQMFEQLKSFKSEYGHCNVPQKWKKNKHLATWVAGQRYEKDRLSIQKLKSLNSIGFDWDPIETSWNQMFEQLKAFKKKHGHCDVPDRWKENSKLGIWVGNQRMKKDHLSSEKRSRLDSIGFDWNPREAAWNQMFEQLLAFKKKYGHCNVPFSYSENKKLGSWVANLRSRKYRLSQNNLAKLDSLGFEWRRQRK